MHTRMLLLSVLSLVLLIGACGSDSPTDPGQDPDQLQDTPAIPRPTSPGGSVPAQSVTLTKVAPQALRDYAPRILDAPVQQAVVQTRAYEDCAWQTVSSPTGFDLAVWGGTPVIALAGCRDANITGAVSAATYAVGEFPLLYADGQLRTPFVSKTVRGCTVLDLSPVPYVGLAFHRVVVTAATQPDEAPYLRRDRFWRVQPIEGQVGGFLLLRGPVSGEVTTSYTAGVSRTESESFGASVTGTVGGQLGPINASISVTLTATFETSVTVSEESTQSFSKAVFGEDGKTIQFMVWELVEVYSLTDANGDPYAIEGWRLDNPTLERGGAALALDATTFIEP